MEKTESIPPQVAPNYWQTAENYLLSESSNLPMTPTI